MTLTFLQGLELGFVFGVAVLAAPLTCKLRLLRFEGLVIARRKAGSR